MKRVGKVFLWLIGAFLVLVFIGSAAGFYSRRIRPHTILSVRIEGDVPEQAAQGPLERWVSGPTTSVTEIAEALDRARTDPRITGAAFRIGESTMNMAKLQEIRERIREFNRAGRFSVAYLEFATNRSYYLASACQSVFLLPKSLLYVRGMMASTMFYRGAFDKLGVVADFYRIGDYKNATNVYTEKKYTQAHREATQALLEDWYREFLRDVADGRRLKVEDVEAAFRKGPLTAQEALDAKLIDKTAYADEARDVIREKNRGPAPRLSVREYLRRTEREGRSKLAVIYATGEILPGRSGMDPFGESVMGSDTIAEQFRRARQDDSIRAVILRVDSPGGAAFSSEVIRRQLERTKLVKPVVVSMSDVAASGGYWISMSANKIVAEPGTITGSIGIYTGKFNLRGLFDRLGISIDSVTTAENSTLDSPFHNFTPAQRDSLRKTMTDNYRFFVRGVAEGRHLDESAVDKIAQGRIWTGERAKQLGLVDELGGLHTAITVARELARISHGEKISLVYLPEPRSLFGRIFDVVGGARMQSPTASLKEWVARLEILARQPIWALLPAVPKVQ